VPIPKSQTLASPGARRWRGRVAAACAGISMIAALGASPVQAQAGGPAGAPRAPDAAEATPPARNHPKKGRVVVTLRDGRVVEGVLLDFGSRTYRIERADGRVETLSERTVREVRFVDAAPDLAVAPVAPPESETVRGGGPRTGTRAPPRRC